MRGDTLVPQPSFDVQVKIGVEAERERIMRDVVRPLVEAAGDMYVAFNLAMVHGQIPAGTENSYAAEAVRAALAAARQAMGPQG